VVPTRATRKAGREGLISQIDAVLKTMPPVKAASEPEHDLRALQKEARRIASETMTEPVMNKFTRQMDGVLLHPVSGLLILIGVLFVVFQSVFAWADPAITAIEDAFSWLQATVEPMIGHEILKGLIVDAAINGVGSVIVFQIGRAHV